MPDYAAAFKPEMAGRTARLEKRIGKRQSGEGQSGPDQATRVSQARRGPRRRKAMFNKILIAVDLSDPAPSPKGLAQAVELAAASGGLLRLVNIQPLMPATFMEYVPADFDAEQEKRARLALQGIVDVVQLPKERVSGAVRVGGIYHEILAEAANWGADLIVVGSHRPVVVDYLLGSNAKTIVRHALCSVLVVRN
jgi:nucleotide-binding universal stress UspA family protein